MQASLLQEIKAFFIKGSILARLVGLNLAVFLLISLLRVTFFLLNIEGTAEAISQWLGISSNVHIILYRPWTLLTYMFVHFDLLHILFNMIVLFVGGRIFSEFIGSDRLTGTYLFGGLAGALFYIVSFNVFPAFSEVKSFSLAIGASASVLAVFVAIAAYMPDYRLPLILLGPVRLKYIALFFVVLDLISIDQGNPGGHLAHLGGACWGFVYARMLKNDIDPALSLGKWLNAFASLFSSRSGMRVNYKSERPVSDDAYNRQRVEYQNKMDAILDKISKGGYDSLSKEEKAFLFRMGNKS
jgi:membrane associated rhomboid family serine protease